MLVPRTSDDEAQQVSVFEVLDPLEEDGWRLERLEPVIDDRDDRDLPGWLVRLRAR